jgi:hypothetical protein
MSEYHQTYVARKDPVLNLVDVPNLARGGLLAGDIGLSADDLTFVAQGVSLLFGLLFVMLARPNLVESGKSTGKKTEQCPSLPWTVSSPAAF